MAIKIRPESNEEYSRTEEVVKKAFLNEEMSDHQEHRLVQKLRNSEAFIPELSLVAIGQHENILGHLMLTTNKIINEKDRKSTRLNSSHVATSYAVFCLKKKKQRE